MMPVVILTRADILDLCCRQGPPTRGARALDRQLKAPTELSLFEPNTAIDGWSRTSWKIQSELYLRIEDEASLTLRIIHASGVFYKPRGRFLAPKSHGLSAKKMAIDHPLAPRPSAVRHHTPRLSAETRGEGHPQDGIETNTTCSHQWRCHSSPQGISQGGND
eukprot:s1551_g7.t1